MSAQRQHEGWTPVERASARLRRARRETPASKQKFDTELLVSEVLIKLHATAVLGVLDSLRQGPDYSVDAQRLTDELLKADSAGKWHAVLATGSELLSHGDNPGSQLAKWLRLAKRRSDSQQLADVGEPLRSLSANIAPGSTPPKTRCPLDLMRLFVEIRNATFHGAFGPEFYRVNTGKLSGANEWIIEESPLWNWDLVLPLERQGKLVGRVMRGPEPMDCIELPRGADAGRLYCALENGFAKLPPVIHIAPGDNLTYLANGRWVPPRAEFLCHSVEADEAQTGKLRLDVGVEHAAEPKPGDLVEDRYAIIEELGRGSVAVAYLARDEEEGGSYVLKRFLHPEDDFEQAVTEFEVTKDLSHPGIPRVWDKRGVRSTFHLLIEHVRGRPLKKLLEARRGDADLCVRVGLEILDVLGYLHGRVLLHRDVTPDNILIPEESTGRICLIDFDLASRPDVIGPRVGAEAYRAPEVEQGEPWTASCDLYSLAVGLFQLLVGRFPYSEGPSRIDKLTPVPARPEEAAGLDTELLSALTKGAAPDSRNRFASASEFANRLREIRAGA